MRYALDTFTPAVEPQTLLARLVDADFRHVARHHVGCLFAHHLILDRGAPTVALLLKPAQISSKQIERVFHEWALAQLFAGVLPDFILFLDRAQWNCHGPRAREHLLFHELCHLRQKVSAFGAPQFDDAGRLKLHLVRHDAELFTAEVERYGSLAEGAEAIADAVHSARAAGRRRSA